MNALSAELIARARWGASYGRKRHLVNHLQIITGRGGQLTVRACCNANVRLDYLDTDRRTPPFGGPTARQRVAGLDPCERCYGLAVTGGIPLTLREETP